jgi:hypothetical protein
MKKALLTLALIALSGSIASVYGEGSGPLRAKLIGTWRLVSATQRLTDGTVRPDPQTGAKGVGYLIYTEGGRVCVVVGNPERSRWSSAQAPSDAELRNAFDGLVAYAGTFDVNEAEHCVVHHIEVDRVPNFTGADRKRFCSLSGNRLVLMAAPPLPAGVKEWTIVWERLGN